MEKSTSGPLFNVFMESFEQNALASFPKSVLFRLWKADNTLVSIHTDHADALFTHINYLHLDIRWTKQGEVDGLLHMLDVDILIH